MSHWCKEVIDAVVPVQPVAALSSLSTGKGLPAQPLPPRPLLFANSFPSYANMAAGRPVQSPPIPPQLRATHFYPSSVQPPTGYGNSSQLHGITPNFGYEIQTSTIANPFGNNGLPSVMQQRLVPGHCSIGSNNSTQPFHATTVIHPQSLNQPRPLSYSGKPTTTLAAEPTSAQSTTALSSWPPTLNAFVMKAFSTCSTDDDRTNMTKELEQLISRVTSQGRLHMHSWESEPVPETRVAVNADVTEKHRKQSKFSPVVVTSEKKWVSPPIASVEVLQEDRLRKQRADRFKLEAKQHKKVKSSHSGSQPSDFNIENLKIIGTSTALEKDYFRLTSAPDPATVRPEPVLRNALMLLKKKWRKNEVEYLYACSQLKAIRQDLTVQHIQTEFTVEVYEIHARIALECDDMNEYNQCQTQLKHLYSLGICGCEAEFVAYRILYYVYLLSNSKYQKGSSDLSFLLMSLCQRADLLRDVAVQHALDVRKAVQLDNYHDFFVLAKSAPNMGSYILSPMLDSARVNALRVVCRSFKPSIDVKFLSQQLGFENMDESVEFLRKAGCIFLDDVDSLGHIDTQKSVVSASAVMTQDKLLL